MSAGVLGLSGLAACSDDATESTQESAHPDTIGTTDSNGDSIGDDPAPTTITDIISTTDDVGPQRLHSGVDVVSEMSADEVTHPNLRPAHASSGSRLLQNGGSRSGRPHKR